MDAELLVKALGGFFAIMNPFVTLPMFLSLTSGYDKAHQRRTALRVTLYSLVMAVVIMVGGTSILGFFGVGVDDFRIAGGIVLMMIALALLNGRTATHGGNAHERAVQVSEAGEGDVSFYPLTFPMIMGPGTITTIIVFTGQAGSVSDYLAVGLALAAVLALLFVVLWFAGSIGRRMSETLRVIMTRLMGMILATISVQMVVAGLRAVLPGLTT